MNDDDDDAVGYGKPPRKNRFAKGMSGNPKGRPKKVKPSCDLRDILNRVGERSVEFQGDVVTMRELEIMSLQHKAAKGDVAASRHLARLRADAGVDEKEQAKGGVLLIPSHVPLDEWEAAAAAQQAQFREKPKDDMEWQ